LYRATGRTVFRNKDFNGCKKGKMSQDLLPLF
jgi:hypothetical protein